MSRRRKNPHPQRAVNARTVLKTEKEEPQEGVRRLVRRILKDPPRSACSFVRSSYQRRGVVSRHIVRKIQNQREKSASSRGGEENIRRMTMIPLNTNQKPDEPPLATTTSPAVQQQKVVATTTTTTTTTTPSSLPKGGGLNQTNNQLPRSTARNTSKTRTRKQSYSISERQNASQLKSAEESVRERRR